MKAIKKDRISREELYISMALLMAKRATCQRLSVGCVITSKEHRIIATGYNGPLPSNNHCTTCDVNQSCNQAVHAEANAIAFAAKEGISLKGSILYLTHSPCETCAKLIIQSGISKVVYDKLFRTTEGLGILEENQIEVRQYPF
jgi:dCMP deaminase